MRALQVVRALGPIDVQSVRRDSLWRWMLLLPLLLGAAVRWVIPDVMSRIGALIQLELLPYYPAVASFALLLITPIMVGALIGFLLLDQRDDLSLAALQVTPLPMRSYLAYRLTVPMLLSFGLTVGALPLAGMAAAGVVPVLLAALAATPLAPIYALALASLAANKVQGFALMKAFGAWYLIPVIAYFVPAPWQWAFGIMPHFWPAQLYWLAQAGEPLYWLALPIGLAYQAVLLAVLMRRFDMVMHR